LIIDPSLDFEFLSFGISLLRSIHDTRMNLAFAREVGLLRYLWRRMLWRVGPPARMELHTGVSFPLPRAKFFASDVFVTQGNVDWNAEYILAAYLKQKSPPGDFLDVGAHIGYYSALLSPFVSNIYAFEPDTRNHPYLRDTLSQIPRAEIIAKAVCDREGRMGFCDNGESSVSHLEPESIRNPQSEIRNPSMVETTTIDSFVAARNANPAAIKVDIEGFDILALQGAAHTARRLHPVFLVEYNEGENAPNTWEALDGFLRDCAYVLYVISSEPRHGISGCHYTFSKRTVGETRRLSTKMLFLVPATDEEWFAQFALKNSRWTSEALRPAAVQAFLANCSGLF
jgi:FkbM family methyltransferase